MKDFCGKSPDDPEVLDAIKNKEPYRSPLGTHKYIDGIGYCCDDASGMLGENRRVIAEHPLSFSPCSFTSLEEFKIEGKTWFKTLRQ